jgi:hypothetical protein
MTQPIKATLNVSLKPWNTPNFAVRAGEDEGAASIPVRELTDDALETLAYAWVAELYIKAGRRLPNYVMTDPSTRPKAGPPSA